MSAAIRFAGMLALAGTLASCGAMPRHAETRIDRPAVVEIYGPAGAAVTLAGRRLGTLGPKPTRFVVPEGMARLRVSANEIALYDGDVFVTRGTTKKIDLSGAR